MVDLKKFDKELIDLERQITLFHAKVINEIDKHQNADVIGFHGQTIYHKSQEKISKQLGDGKLLSQLTKKKVVYNFRQNDLRNGGQGAPLTPIFHNALGNKLNKKFDLGLDLLHKVLDVDPIPAGQKTSDNRYRDLVLGYFLSIVCFNINKRIWTILDSEDNASIT